MNEQPMVHYLNTGERKGTNDTEGVLSRGGGEKLSDLHVSFYL